MNSMTLDLQTETFNSPSSTVLDFTSEHPYDLSGRSQTSVIDVEDDVSQQIERNLEGDSADTSPPILPVNRNLDNYNAKRVTIIHPPSGGDGGNDGEEGDAANTVDSYFCELEQESSEGVEPVPLVHLQNVQSNVDPQFLHSMPILTPMANCGAQDPSDSNVIVLPQPQTHVVHCGNLQLTQQDIQQIQQQIQHRLLNQTMGVAPPPVHLPPQQYVILGTVGSTVPVSTQYISGFSVNNASTVQQSTIPLLQQMTHIQPHPPPAADNEVTPSSDSALTTPMINSNILNKPTSTLTKAPLTVGPSPQYINLHASNTAESVAELEELQKFAKHFKQRRVELGFTQGDVGAALGKSFPNDFSQTTISRFEASNLSPQNMRKLKPLLERWLEDQQQVSSNYISDTFCGRVSPDNGASDSKRRKKRTTIEDNVKDLLEFSFQSNPKPNASSLTKIANEHNIKRDVVRVWFCNRRQREKRLPKYTMPILIQGQPAAVYQPMNNQPVLSNCIETDVYQTSRIIKSCKGGEKSSRKKEEAAISATMASPQGHAIRDFIPPTIFHNS